MENQLRWIALVMLAEPALPSLDSVVEALAECYDEPPRIIPAGGTENLLTCTLGDYTAAVTLVDRPVPWSQLEGPCSTAWYWPTAAEALRDHPAHLLVTLVDEGGKSIEKCTLLTQFVAGILKCSPTVGVFWGPGRLVHPAEAFVEQAVQLTPEDLPLFLWIDFRVEKFSEDHCRLYTTGMESLGYQELEVPRFADEPQELLEHAYNITHYQLCKQKTIDNNETIGLRDDLQAIARRQPSMLDEQMEVISLEFESSASSGDL